MQSRAARIVKMVIIQNKNISDTIKGTTSHALDITKNNSSEQQLKLKPVEKNLEVENEIPPIKPQNVNVEETRTDMEYANDKEGNEKNKEDLNCIYKSINNSEDGKLKLISDKAFELDQVDNEQMNIKGNNMYENGQFSEDSEFDNFSSESEYIPDTTSASESENEKALLETSTEIPFLPEGCEGTFIITIGFYLQ